MVFDKIQSLCPDHFCFHSPKLHKEQFLLSHSHLTTSAFVTICLGTNMADSNRRQDKSHVGENQELHLGQLLHLGLQHTLRLNNVLKLSKRS